MFDRVIRQRNLKQVLVGLYVKFSLCWVPSQNFGLVNNSLMDSSSNSYYVRFYCCMLLKFTTSAS